MSKCKNLDTGNSGNDSCCKLTWTGELCDSMENPQLCEDYEEELPDYLNPDKERDVDEG